MTNKEKYGILNIVKEIKKQTDKQSDLSKQNFKKPLTSTAKCGIIKIVKEQFKIFYGAQHNKYLKKVLDKYRKVWYHKDSPKGQTF